MRHLKSKIDQQIIAKFKQALLSLNENRDWQLKGLTQNNTTFSKVFVIDFNLLYSQFEDRPEGRQTKEYKLQLFVPFIT